MLCPACSHDVPNGAKFCTNCGHRFAVQAAAPMIPPAAAPTGRSVLDIFADPPNWKTSYLFVGAGVSVIATMAACAFVWALAQPTKPPVPPAPVEMATPSEDYSRDDQKDFTAAIDRLPARIPADDLAKVCRAGIAHAFQRKPSIVKIVDNTNGLARVRYRRPEDGKRWTFDCKVNANRILWRTVNAFGDGDLGRWRVTADDEVLIFELKGSKVKITSIQPDGSDSTETYTVGAN